MKQLGPYGIAFLFGFFLYALVEILFRGYTHWTMALTGGLVLLVLYRMKATLRASRWTLALLGTAFITAMEFTVGVWVNLILGWGVWDYSDLQWNILGQVCLPFSLIWFVLCIPAQWVCGGIAKQYQSAQIKSP